MRKMKFMKSLIKESYKIYVNVTQQPWAFLYFIFNIVNKNINPNIANLLEHL